MRTFIVATFLFFFSNLLCQINTIEDVRLEKWFNKKQSQTMIGYRVQIGFDSDKSKIETIRNKFIGSYPKIDTYVNFNPPYFNLKVGDFRTEIEAQKFAEKIQGDFGLNIVFTEQINLPRID
jgi:hypothetical protein